MTESDLDWKRFNDSKWHLMSTIGLGLTHSALFPLFVVKTRMQNETTQKTFITVVRELITCN
ncbi:hypothetical protein A2U01_0034529, partial [Trifolium medium]|nr:hypothetical protein [Trifolium medium]